MVSDNNNNSGRSPYPDDDAVHPINEQLDGDHHDEREPPLPSERDESLSVDPEGNQVPGEEGEQQENRGEAHPSHGDRDTLMSDMGHQSETPTERYQKRAAQASTVWCNGILSGRSYAPRPKHVEQAELTEDEKEALLRERTFTIPRGYKYYTADLPAVLSPVPQNGLRTAVIVHIVSFFIAFVFTLASACPIPWYRGKNVTARGVNYNKRTFTLWRASGGAYPEVSVRTMKDCPIEKQFYQTIAASTIMGCVFSLFAIISSIMRLTGRSAYGWILMLSVVGFGWTLCGNAMSVSLFYLSRCDAPRFANTARLDAGFALTLVAWVFQLGGLLSIVLSTKLNVGPVLRELRVMDTIYMFLIAASLALFCIANASTVWKRRFKTDLVDVVRVTYWHTELIMPNGTNLYYGRRHYRCGAYGKRMKASISFLILGSVAVFLAVMLAIPAFVSRGCRIASLVFSILTLVFIIISWVTAVAVRYRKSCTGPVADSMYASYPGVPSGIFNGLTDFPGYGVQEGLILVIIGWCLTLLAVILNFVFPWPEVVL